jgi:hypothetical protein
VLVLAFGILELPAVLLVDPHVVGLLPLAVVRRAAEYADVPGVMPSPVVVASRGVDVVQLRITSALEWAAAIEASSVLS